MKLFPLLLPPTRRHSLLRTSILPLALLLGLAAGASGAEKPADLSEMDLEQLMEVEVATVVAASSYEQKTTEAPASISIVTADDIRRFGYRTLADILNSVVGFYTTSDRNYAYLGMRGFSPPGDFNSRILLLIDGHRVNDSVYNQAPIGTDFPLDVDLIERVEIIRGPTSSLYGANAFFGAINIVTATPANREGAEIAADGSDRGGARARVTWGAAAPGKGPSGLLSATLYHDPGASLLHYREFGSADNPGGAVRDADADRSRTLFGTLSWNDFTLQTAYGSRTKVVPTASYGTVFGDRRLATTDERFYVEARLLREVTEETTLFLRTSFNIYRYAGTYPFAGDDGAVFNRDLATGKWTDAEARVTRDLPYHNRLTMGAEFRADLVDSQRNYDVQPYASYLSDSHGARMFAGYLQEEYRPLPSLLLSGGLRVDNYSTFGTEVSPRVAFIYLPSERHSFKVLAGAAFRPPNGFEFYYGDGGISMKANPNLEPEKIRTYELVWEGHPREGLRITSSLFHYWVDDIITQQVDPQDGLLVFRNSGKANTHGGDVEVQAHHPSGATVRGSYSYQWTTATDQALSGTDSSDRVMNSPAHLVKLNVSLPVWKGYVSPEVQFTSRRRTLRGHAGAYAVMNLTLFSAALLDGVEVSASVYNVLDHSYSDPVSEAHQQDTIRQDGRSLRLKASYRF